MSYSREDVTKARRLFASLEEMGANPWIDEQNLQGGQEWAQEIKDALEKADLVFFLGSKTTEKKIGVVQEEARAALELQKRRPQKESYLIPLRLEDCNFPHADMDKLQWINLFPDWEEGIEKIRDVVRRKKQHLLEREVDSKISL